MKRLRKLGLPLSLVGMLALGSTSVFAGNLNYDYIPSEPKAGFEIDYSAENVAEYNGSSIQSRTPVLISSGVSRYVNHSNGQYYAKGATLVLESTTGKHLEHTTTVTLGKISTVLVSGSNKGIGEVWAETPTTPTAGTAKVYWKTN